MKKIICEMCGSNDLLKKDGVFECQSCGTKYSVEEAKKMMVEGVVSVEGTVKIDNTAQVNNYLKMANSAYNSSNLKEAEQYANKIIELEPSNSEAWFIKGKTAGWQSTTVNNRIMESIECWGNAVKHCNKDKLASLKEEIKDEFVLICKALVKLNAEHFADYPIKKNRDNLCNFVFILNSATILLIKSHIIIPIEELTGFAAEELNSAAVSGYKYANEYYGTKKEDKNKYKYSNWIEYMDNCIYVLEKAMPFAKNEKTLDNIFSNLEYLQNDVINSCSYQFVATGYGSYYDVDTTLTAAAKQARRKTISNYSVKKAEILAEFEEKRKKKIEKYWEEHAEEKERLLLEIKDQEKKIDDDNKKLNELLKERADLFSTIENTPACKELKNCKEKIQKLTSEKQQLGLFKVKQKKELQEQIDRLNEESKSIYERATKEFEDAKTENQKEIDKLNNKIDKITKEVETAKKIVAKNNKELTRDRN